jgi:hypothetical protein
VVRGDGGRQTGRNKRTRSREDREAQITLNMSSKNVRRGALLAPGASSPAEAEDAELDDALARVCTCLEPPFLGAPPASSQYGYQLPLSWP